MGVPLEAVERDDAGDQVGQAARQRGFDRVRMADHAPDLVVVQLGGEGFLHLPNRAAEGEPAATLGDFVDGEALTLQPSGHDRKVSVHQAEAGSELLGREPVMEIRRGRILLRREKRTELRLRTRAARELKNDPVQWQVGRGSAHRQLGPGMAGNRTVQDDTVGVVDDAGLGDLACATASDGKARRRVESIKVLDWAMPAFLFR